MEEEKIKNLEKEVERASKRSNLYLSFLIFFIGLFIGSLFLGSSFNFLKRSPGSGQGVMINNPALNTQGLENDDPFLGSKEAKVIIIEFSDFQCPFCRRFWRESLQQIRKEYIETGKSVKFVYRDFPLSFHNLAQKYAEAGECAEEQGKFWEMHDKIFQEQDKKGQGTISDYSLGDIKRWAREIGVNSSKFDQCLDSGKYKQEVENDVNEGLIAGVNGTPTIFINGRIIVGAQPYQVFKKIIDEELSK